MTVQEAIKPRAPIQREVVQTNGLAWGAWAGLSALVGLFAAHAFWIAAVNEDAYISFRYAENFLNGDGLVFNAGAEPVEGITNLLWTLILAAGARVTGLELPALALALGILCGVLTLILAYHWCRTELESTGVSRIKTAYAALLAPALLVLAPGFTLYSGSGLETSPFALLVTCGLYALSRAGSLRRCAVAGALLGAAALTRPDGALVLALGLIACVLRGKQRIGGAAAYALTGFSMLAVVTLWRVLYYGSPVPNTFFAKAGGFDVMQRWGWPYLMEATYSNWFQLAFLLALGAGLLNRGFLRRNLATLALVPVWCVYVVYAGGDYMPAGRFLIPILPALYVLAVAGGVTLGRTAYGLRRFSRRTKFLIVGLPLVALSAAMALQVPGNLRAELDEQAEEKQWVAYRQAVVRWLDSQGGDPLVAANAVGLLGYYSDARMLDMLGLNDSHIAHFGNRDPKSFPGHQVGDGRYVLAQEPDYIIPFSVRPEFQWGSTAPFFVGDKELAELPDFGKEYESLKVRLDNGQDLSVLRRKPSAD
jgi:arabinofuranosyltransferase